MSAFSTGTPFRMIYRGRLPIPDSPAIGGVYVSDTGEMHLIVTDEDGLANPLRLGAEDVDLDGLQTKLDELEELIG